jgi:GMP synthase-like glutamine amidotransferase
VRVLSLTHGPSVPGGLFEELVEESGHELVRWLVPDGGGPERAGGHEAVLVFGGSMHPDEDDRFGWLGHEERFLREVLERGVPALGVCLGAQMLARAAGARVGPAAEAEIGWFPVELTAGGRADSVLGVLPDRVEAFQWHRYTFDVPEGGVELAHSAVCSQAFRVGNAWGLQFHAEATLPMVRDWAQEDPDDLPYDAGRFLAESDARIDAWNEHGRRLCAAFLDAAAAA